MVADGETLKRASRLKVRCDPAGHRARQMFSLRQVSASDRDLECSRAGVQIVTYRQLLSCHSRAQSRSRWRQSPLLSALVISWRVIWVWQRIKMDKRLTMDQVFRRTARGLAMGLCRFLLAILVAVWMSGCQKPKAVAKKWASDHPSGKPRICRGQESTLDGEPDSESA
jgi:hypothetical protein